ncbi:MAG: hypothetical protein IH955_02660 [Chloroflexi bacterium]|nr:hypothetical protein [Chloroflexota bacterium]
MPKFKTGQKVKVTLYPVDSSLVGQLGTIEGVRGIYGSRGAEGSIGTMLATPGEMLYIVGLQDPPPRKPKRISVRESGLQPL